MQYVPSPTLQTALERLGEIDRRTGWSGAHLLTVIDANWGGPAVVHPDDYSTRVDLQQMDQLQVVCFLSAEFGDGLQFAHGNEVLQRDIKPANILLNAMGRPLQVDFNLTEDYDRPAWRRRTGPASVFTGELNSCRRRKFKTEPIMQTTCLEVSSRHPVTVFVVFGIFRS